MTMTPEIAAGLRTPFPREHIGKLPRIWCGKCRSERTKVCGEHQKSRCRECDNNITTAHLHLDYVGHAEVTDRLLAVDPEWTWEPMAFSADGLPARDSNGGLWIRLSVAGVTRIGYGDAQGKEGPDAVKEAIGDAIRNAAMRFGVALDLWSKHPIEDTAATVRAPQPGPKRTPVDEAKAQLRQACTDNGWDVTKVAALFEDKYKAELREATNATVIDQFRESLFTQPQEVLMAA